MINDIRNDNHSIKYKMIYISTILIAFIIFDFFIKNILKSLTTYLFFTPDNTRCDYFIFSNYVEKGLKYFLFYFVFNYINIYSSLFMIFLDSLSLIISSNLKLIYKEERPYFSNTNYPTCEISITYSNPSNSALSLYLIFGCFYRAILSKKNNNTKEKKLILIVLWVLSLLFICTEKLFLNYVYLNDILYGIILGYIIYYIFFDIIQIDFNNLDQFKFILEYKLWFIFSILGYFLIYSFYQFIITKPYINSVNSYVNLNYIMLSKVFELLGFYLAVYLEYYLVFNLNFSNYVRYNIKERNLNGIEMFNNTSKDVSLFRFILICFIDFYLQDLILNKYKIYSVNKLRFDNYLHLIWSLNLFSLTFHGIIVFFVIKNLLRYFGMTNENIFNNGYKQIINN